MQRNSLIFFLFFLVVLPLRSQEYKYEWGAMGGSVFYLGDASVGSPFSGVGAGVSVIGRYNINFRMAGFLSADYRLFRGKTSENITEMPISSPIAFHTHAFFLSPCFEYNFYPYSDKFSFLGTRRLTPYISVGLSVGVGFSNVSKQSKLFFIPGMTGGIGVKYKIANRWNVQAQLSGRYYFSDRLEGGVPQGEALNNPYGIAKPYQKGNDGEFNLMLGVSYEWGRRTRSCNSLK